MRIVSLNVGPVAALGEGEQALRTGIVKRPAQGRIALGPEGLEGDGQANRRVHGGPDRAVYAYPVAHYAHWEIVLGRDDLVPGFVGENLTVDGPDEDEVRLGDRYRGPDALLEVSQPRLPCRTLGRRVGDPGFPAVFMASGRLGWYLRVVEAGSLAAGDELILVSRDPAGMSVRALAALRGEGASPEDLDRGAAQGALTLDWRESFAARAIAARRAAR